MRKQCVPGALSPPPMPGNEASTRPTSYPAWPEYEAASSAHCVCMWEKVINVEFLFQQQQGVEPEKLFAVPLEAKHNKVFVSVS